MARTLAAENLALGRAVVVDGVHWAQAQRTPWRDVVGGHAIWIEIHCSDPGERTRRLMARPSSARRDWGEIAGLDMASIEAPDIRVETAGQSPEASIAALIAALPPEIRG